MSKSLNGFVYIWYDRKHKRYYIGSHWGSPDDGYVCSSPWMKQAYLHRPTDFKRRILKVFTTSRQDMVDEEHRYLGMIKSEEMIQKHTKDRSGVRYYNLRTEAWYLWHHKIDARNLTISQKISASKKGKNTGPRDPSVGIAISLKKKEAFAKKRKELGYSFSPEHRKKMSETHIGTKHTEEWKQNNARMLREQWASGVRKAKVPKYIDVPKRVRGERMKELWKDPVWAANQQAKLKIGSARRHGKPI